MSNSDADRRKGFTETLVCLYFGETIGETMFVDELLKRRGLDLSTDEGQQFLSRFVVGQLKANLRMSQEIDTLRDELQELRLIIAERT